MSQRFHHQLPFGAEIQPDGNTLFRIWAPSSPDLQLRIGNDTMPMHAEPGGWHSLRAPAPAGTPYCYVMPDGLAVPDPASRLQRTDVHDPSVVVDPGSYIWRHPDWKGRPWHEAVIYECHAGLMGGFKGLEAELPRLAALGITAIELMPVNDVPGQRNWGYDGVLPFAPDTALGNPDELKSLIDAAHGLDLMMLLDVVYNHFGPDGAYIHALAKLFFREDLKSPWGAAIDFRRPEVREFFEQNALYWLNEYRFDGLRYDAVSHIKEDAFLVEMASKIRKTTDDRKIHLTLEHEDNRAALIRTVDGDSLYDAQWTDDFHHAMHVLLTGETEGYYEDFTDATNLLVRCMAEGFAYQGQVSKHSGKPRGEPSGYLPTTAFIIFLQNHDQIGNRALGDRLTASVAPESLRAATAFMLLTPFIPMLFMGEETASKTPFQFFTDHHDELAELVRTGRRSEFGAFAAFKDESRRAHIPDPNAIETYENSRPCPGDPTHAAWLASILALRREHVTPNIPGCRTAGAEAFAPGAIRATWKREDAKILTVLLNLGDKPIKPTPASPPTRGDIIFSIGGATPSDLPPSSLVVLLG